MRAGDLVKVTRASIGVPLGSVGLIIKSHKPRAETIKHSIHEVQLYGVKLGCNRRFLSRDLEVVNESR
jgi:hypothetical protein